MNALRVTSQPLPVGTTTDSTHVAWNPVVTMFQPIDSATLQAAIKAIVPDDKELRRLAQHPDLQPPSSWWDEPDPFHCSHDDEG